MTPGDDFPSIPTFLVALPAVQFEPPSSYPHYPSAYPLWSFVTHMAPEIAILVTELAPHSGSGTISDIPVQAYVLL